LVGGESFRVGCSCRNDSFSDGEEFFIDRSLLMGGNSPRSRYTHYIAIGLNLR